MNNNNANWNEWERRYATHPVVRIYLKVVALIACTWLLFHGWSYCAAESQLNIRCLYINQPECLGLDPPSITQVFAFGIHIFLYLMTPFFSLVGQIHHIAIWLKPSLWRPCKLKFCQLHRVIYFPLIHLAYLTAINAISSMFQAAARNPMDPAFEENGIIFYGLSSVDALLSFAFILQFPIYKTMTDYEERLCAVSAHRNRE